MSAHALRVLAGTCILLSVAASVDAQTRYVAAGNPGAAAPYTSWATAAADIQTAVDAAVDGDTVLVSNGTYVVLSNISVTKGITVRSVNGAAATVIDGGGTTRCVYMNHPNAVLDGFTIRNGYNPPGFGGGVNIGNGGTVRNCVIHDNQARDGGGVAIDNNGLVENCIIRDNLASDNGASGFGGGVRLLSGGTVRGCLVVHNRSIGLGGGINIWNAGLIENCTVVSNTAPDGAGVRTRNQGIVVNSIIYFNNGLDCTVDGSGYGYTNCCTSVAGSLPGSGNIAYDPLLVNPAGGDFRLQPISPCNDAALPVSWMAGAKDLDGNDRILHGAPDMGAYESVTVLPPVISGDIHYVVPGNPGALAPYTSWDTAAATIQDAIGAAAAGHTVLVTNGTYMLTGNLSITGDITVRSVNGAAATVIDGGGTTRCVYMNHPNAVLDGFTIRNGYNPPGFGGGVNIGNGGTVRNCVIHDNQARDGGGVAIDNNGLVENCIIRDNLASDNGASGFGGGVRLLSGGTVRGCLVVHNRSIGLGGGINIWDAGLIENCTVVSNTAPDGAGVRTRNQGIVVNSVIYFNNGLDCTVDGSGYGYTNCCTSVAGSLPGSGNISDDPQFVNAATGDYRLQTGSPCVDSGVFRAWMTGAVDLDGIDRIVNGTVDRGAYECLPFCDLEVTKSVNQPLPSEGDTVLFTLTVSNCTAVGVTGVQIADVWPAGLTLIGSSPSQGSYDAGVWNVGTLAAGGRATLILSARVDEGTAGTAMTNVALLAAVTPPDNHAANNEAAATVYVELADLSLTKTGELSTCVDKWAVPLSKEGDFRTCLDNDRPGIWMPNVFQFEHQPALSCDEWHHIVYRFRHGPNPSDGHTMDKIVDGVVVEQLAAGGLPMPGNGPLFIGSYLGQNAFFHGAMDELRLSRIWRSEDWLLTSYRQQKNPSDFLAAGPEQAGTLMAFEKLLGIDPAKVAGRLTNFPVLVSLQDPDLRTVSNGGHVESSEGWDIVFTLPDGMELPHEVERFTGNDGRLVAWVLLPLLSPADNLQFVLHYGDASVAAPTEHPSAVWDDDFVMVQHMEEPGGPVKDSTAFGNDGVNQNARPVPFGLTGGAYAFNGTNAQIVVPHAPSLTLTTGDYTIEYWVQRRPLPANALFQIVVSNAGPDPADDVVVADRMTCLSFVDAFTKTGQYDGANGLWYVGRLEAGASATNWVLADATCTGVLVNTAEVLSAKQADPNSPHGNNAPDEDDQAVVTLREVQLAAWMRPDFTITSLTLDPVVPTAGSAFSAVVTIKNQGAAPGSAGALKVWVNKGAQASPADAGDQVQTAGMLDPGQTATYTFTGLTAPAAAGTYTCRAFVDGEDAVAEMSEGNNQKTATYTLSGSGSGSGSGSWQKPDFVVTSVVLTPSPTEVGETFSAKVTILNQGPLAGDAGDLKLWIAHGPSLALPGEVSDRSAAIGTLNAGDSVVLAFNGLVAPDTAGTYHCLAFVDGSDAIAEMSEGNNQKTATYTLSGPGSWQKPDFVVTSVVLTPSPTAVGEIFSAQVTVLNQGPLAGDAGDLKLWVAHGPSHALPGDAPDRSVAIGTLDAGASVVLTFDGLVAPDADGTYHCLAFADGSDAVAEMSEGNNQKTATYTVHEIWLDIEHRPDGILLKWRSRDGWTYRIERATNLVVGFEVLVPNVPATPPQNTYLDTGAPPSGAQYRVYGDH